jgi:hypothetical protein
MRLTLVIDRAYKYLCILNLFLPPKFAPTSSLSKRVVFEMAAKRLQYLYIPDDSSPNQLIEEKELDFPTPNFDEVVCNLLTCEYRAVETIYSEEELAVVCIMNNYFGVLQPVFPIISCSLMGVHLVYHLVNILPSM